MEGGNAGLIRWKMKTMVDDGGSVRHSGRQQLIARQGKAASAAVPLRQNWLDLNVLPDILDNFSAATGLAASLAAPGTGEILMQSGGEDVCARFHRVNAQSARQCTADCEGLLAELPQDPGRIHLKRCHMRLTNGATPLIIQGAHVADLYVGHALLESPDIDWFRQQAECYGFDQRNYLASLKKMEVVGPDQFQRALSLLSRYMTMMVELGLQNLAGQQGEQALRRSEARYRQLVEGAPEGVLLHCDGRIAFANVAAVKMAGVDDAAALIGQPVEQLIVFPDEWSGAPTAEGGVGGEGALLRRDGASFAVEASSAPLTVDGREMVRLTVHAAVRRQEASGQTVAEAPYRALAEQTLVGVYLIQDGRLAYVNPWIEKTLGYRLEELNAMDSIFEVICPEDRARLTGAADNIHYRFGVVARNGERLEIEALGRAMAFNGRPAAIGVAVDITARLRAERALRQSETRFKAIFDNAPVGIGLMHDASGRYTQVNHRWSEMLGYTAEELLQLTHLDVTHPGDRAKSRSLRNQLINGKKAFYRLEKRFIRKDGTLFWGNAQVAVIRGANGDPGVTVSMVTDITELKRTAEQLQESEEQLRTLINATPDAILFKDGEGRWLHANQAVLRLFGLEAASYQGKTDAELAAHAHPLYRKALRSCDVSDRQAWECGEPFKVEEVIPMPDGGQRILQTVKVPLYQADGMRHGLLALGHDITDFRRAEQALRDQFELSQALLKAQSDMGEGIFIIESGRVVYANEALCRLYDYTVEEILALKSYALLIHPDDRRWVMDNHHRRLTGEPVDSRYEISIATRNGERREVEIAIAPLAIGGIVQIVVVMIDISERKHNEEKLRLAAEVFNTASEGIIVTDAESRIITVNPAFVRITGYQESEVREHSPRFLSSSRHGSAFFRRLWTRLKRYGRWQGEIWERRKSGELFPAWLSISQVKDAKDEVVNYVSILSDITERKANEERMARLAHFDHLTDLPNRLLFRERLEQALLRSQRSGELVGVMFIDLDSFKQVNDTLGHDIGDLLLQAVATRFSACMRRGDTVSRLGGDEFVVLLQNVRERRSVVRVAEKILQALVSPFDISGRALSISASIGIAVAPMHGADPAGLMKSADVAMYQAKARGRNNFQFFSPPPDA